MNKESRHQPANDFVSTNVSSAPPTGVTRHQPDLDRHESVREHLQQRLSHEVAQLEARIAVLRNGRAPHKAIIIATYERMIARKVSFMSNWGLQESPFSHRY